MNTGQFSFDQDAQRHAYAYALAQYGVDEKAQLFVEWLKELDDDEQDRIFMRGYSATDALARFESERPHLHE